NGGLPAHGGNNLPLRGEKKSLYEGGVRGLAFVHSPDFSEDMKGTVYTELMHITDWFPTLLGLASDGSDSNSEESKPLDGFDQWESISTGTASLRKAILLNIDPLQPPPQNKDPLPDEWTEEYDTSIMDAIRVGDWKLLTGNPGVGIWTPGPESGQEPVNPSDSPGKFVWLFNIAEDPNETAYFSEENPEIS
ncbi:arylsulfatase B-like, partial [Saccoglossus kowalevskii]|uniref:Arylsulfatase B-like n=1 Tax=Saccoglossus kowalevskii TaxID=10224 RepID=A0ABM0MFG7_SACKO